VPALVEAMLPIAAAKITAAIRVNLLTLHESKDNIIFF
jgi:hypothetical protein